MIPKRHDTGQASGELIERELTGKIIECYLIVYNTLDVGMLESVYR